MSGAVAERIYSTGPQNYDYGLLSASGPWNCFSGIGHFQIDNPKAKMPISHLGFIIFLK